MPFWMPPPVGLVETQSLTFKQATNDPADQTSYTFAGQALGDASPSRRIFVAVQTVHTSASFALSFGTIAGVSATIHVQQTHQPTPPSGVGAHVAIMSALVPSGTTGDIVVTYNAGTFQSTIGVWDAKALVNSSPTDTQTDTLEPGNVTLNIPVNGIAIAAVSASGGSATAWTGVTEDYEGVSQAAEHFSAGSALVPAGDATRAIQSSITGAGGSYAMAALSFA